MEGEVKFKKEKEAPPDKINFYVKLFDNFLNLSDEPGRHITDKEKNDVLKSRNVQTLNKLMAEKTGGEYKNVIYPSSKYRKNAFNFLSAVELLFKQPKFLEKISKKEKERLSQEVENLIDKIRDLRINDAPITKVEIDRGVALINELKQIILR